MSKSNATAEMFCQNMIINNNSAQFKKGNNWIDYYVIDCQNCDFRNSSFSAYKGRDVFVNTPLFDKK